VLLVLLALLAARELISPLPVLVLRQLTTVFARIAEPFPLALLLPVLPLPTASASPVTLVTTFLLALAHSVDRVPAVNTSPVLALEPPPPTLTLA